MSFFYDFMFQLFDGITNYGTIKKNTLTQPLTRYIRFIPTEKYRHKTMRVGIYGYLKACENSPLGIESGAIQDGSITASSAQHLAQNARLHYTSGSSWCASTSDSDPYLQIDLRTSHLICAVSTQGNSMADQWVKTYQIDTSTDGTTWTTYQENNIDRIFYGNYDRSTVARRILYRCIITRYLRIVPTTSQTDTPCLRTEIYGYPFQTSCSSHSVGIPSTSLVPNHRFTATSTSQQNKPFKGRLGGSQAWAASTQNTPGDYLQIDLGALFYICAVATQGLGENRDEYVKKYEVLYSTNNVQWPTYHNKSGEKEFSGNSDRTTVVTNAISNPFRARFVRVLPTEYERWKMLRVDFKGLPLGCTSSLGLENSQIPDSHLTSSSSSDNSHAAPRGRLYGNSSWCSQTNGSNEYIQIDLGQVKTVTGIATQGNPHMNAWVTSYKVSYSFDNTHWNEYKEGQVVKNLEGNSDRNGVRVNWLRNPIAARYIRITPQTHNSGSGHCLRFEGYGCDIFVAPKVILDTVDFILPSIKGSSITLTCSVLGEPAPDIQWFNNGTKINGATQSTLQVQFISAEDVMSKYNCTRQDPNTRAVVCNTFYTCRIVSPLHLPSGGINEASRKVTVFLNVSKAPNVTAKLNKRSITTKWPAMTASDDVGTINSYNIQLSNQSSTVTYNAHHPASNYTIERLNPYTNYSIRVKAISVVGQGLWSSRLDVRTLIAAPDIGPQYTTATKINDTTFLVTWQPLTTDQSNGVVTMYEIFWSIVIEGGRSGRSLQDMFNTTTQATQYTLYNLRLCANYTVSVRGHTSVGPGPKSTINILTSLAQPGRPTDVQAESQTKTSIRVRWEKPLPLSLVVYEYTIEVKGSKPYWSNYSFSSTHKQNGAQTNTVIDGLNPGTSYEFWVTASAACGSNGKSESSKKDTDIDNPVKPTGNSITLKNKFDVPLWSVDPVNGPISSYQVIVIKGCKELCNLPTNISDYKDAQELYVTAELKPNEIKSSFPVGDNKIYGQYKNVPLDKGKTYVIAERAITNHYGKIYAGQAAVVATVEVTQDSTEYCNCENIAKEVVSYVIPLVLIILVLIICIVYLVYRLRRKEKQHNESIMKKIKNKTEETVITNDVMDNSYYSAGDVITNSRKPEKAKADEIEAPGYMELQPRQSSNTIYQSIQEPGNRPRKSETQHTRGMTSHEQYMDLKPRVNTEYETLQQHKKYAREPDYEDVNQGFSRNITVDATEA